MANLYGPRIVTDGLVLCLDAGNSKSYPGSGTVWTDLSGNGNNGTLINNPTFVNTNKGFLSTDGIDDYIGLINNDGLGNFFSSFTIELTINTGIATGADTIGYVIHRGVAQIVGSSVYAIYTSGTSLVFSINGNNNNITLLNRNNVLANYSYVWNGTTVNLYINGVLNTSFNFTTFTNTIIGSVSNLGSTSLNVGYRPAKCDFFNVKIYNRSLSENEVKQNYNATKGRYGL